MLLLSTLLLSLLSSLGVSGFLYISHTVQHATTPLETVEECSMTQCAVYCHLTDGCVKWSSDPVTRLCQLWPLHSDSNPLTAAAEPLHQPILPEGFIVSDDPSIAYKQRAFSIIGGNVSIISSCRAYDPESFPAFPHTEQQINYLKTHVTGSYYWIGIWDQETEGVFKDMTTGQTVDLPAAWWWNGVVDTSTTSNCMTLYGSGLWAVACDSEHAGHICQHSVPERFRTSSAQ
ncbi:hypothetical protein FJT64_020379 [Amphibalanus amphitrite]|uniref:Uncharacterized protein n=1 Tax=Amphibalanus amphitrite TaxID=1232801 RepID=A0A6A4X0R8_AMPAM|nr:hypothetical protein FJT64_020379 [Amphibalanus amphitrite]